MAGAAGGWGKLRRRGRGKWRSGEQEKGERKDERDRCPVEGDGGASGKTRVSGLLSTRKCQGIRRRHLSVGED